jgi:hypothetical protein
MTLGFIRPSRREKPFRWVIRSRPMFLAPVIRSVAPKAWAKTAPEWRKMLAKNPAAYRDGHGLRWLWKATIPP